MLIPPTSNQQALYRNSDPDADGGGGGFADTSTTKQTTGAEASTTVAPATEAGAQTGGEPTKAGSMLEAMFGQKNTAAPTAEEAAAAAATGKTVQQLRDERGRFAGRAPTEGQQPDPTKPPPAAKPGEKPEHQMPEGLSPKAQERFQTLVNANKEATAKLAEFQPIVESARALQQTFHENGIKREQFEQAMQVVGLMNRGDLRGALAALDEQRRLISLHLNEPVSGVDLLAGHPDLQAAVDNLQITPQHAEELARAREARNLSAQQAQRQHQAQQQERQQQQTEQQAQQAHRAGLTAVDNLCKQLQSSDLDYARIEPMLLKEIQGGLLQDVPPARWAALVQKTYDLIKQTATQTRASTGATLPVLRPTGGEAPTAKPKNAFEAMWGAPKPAGA